MPPKRSSTKVAPADISYEELSVFDMTQYKQSLQLRVSVWIAKTIWVFLLVYVANGVFSLSATALQNGARDMLRWPSIEHAFLLDQVSFLLAQLPLLVASLAAVAFLLVAISVWVQFRLWRDRSRYHHLFSADIASVTKYRDQQIELLRQAFFRGIDEGRAALALAASSSGGVDDETASQHALNAFETAMRSVEERAEAELLPISDEIAEVSDILQAIQKGNLSRMEAIDRLAELKSGILPSIQRLKNLNTQLMNRVERAQKIESWFHEDPILADRVDFLINKLQSRRRLTIAVALTVAGALGARLLVLLGK